MARFSRWLKRDYDGVITLVVVCVAIVLDVWGVLEFNQVILLVLGLLAFTILRERRRQDRMPVLGLLAFTILRERRREDRMPDRGPQAVRVLDSVEMRRELEDARRHTDRWWFKGGTGTYLRAVTLRECVENAEREHRPLRVRVEIIDPTNEDLCDNYAAFRSAHADRTGEPWTPARTRCEAFATILAACWYVQRHTILTMEVALSGTAPTFRWDLSEGCVFMTQEFPSPHLMFRDTSPHYSFYARELDFSFRQARRVHLERARKCHLSEEPSTYETRNLFRELGLEIPSSMGDPDVAQVVRKALHATNPYP